MLILLIAAPVSCRDSAVGEVERKDLAFFNIGRLEDELDLFALEGERSLRSTDITMRDGLFCISNGNGQKVIRCNSYGDLLLMIYNDETNPPPFSLKENEPGVAATGRASAYSLNAPSKIAVDSGKNIFVADRLPPEQHAYDREEQALLDMVILRFDGEGTFGGYIGQEGPGGMPFSYIESLSVSKDDELVAVCRYPESSVVYIYDSAGRLLSKIKFVYDKLPLPEGKRNLTAALDGIAVAPDEPVLYIKVDYYRQIYDETINALAGMESDSSRIWVVDMEDGGYKSSCAVPFFEYVYTENNERVSENLFFSLFGAMHGGKVFLYSPVEEGFSVLILAADGSGKQRRGTIKVTPEELRFFTFNVSYDGIVSALLAGNYQTKLVWWRTDRLAAEIN